MSRRAHPPVGDPHVPGGSGGMDVLPVCQIVAQQGCTDQWGEEPSTGMAEGQQAGDGEATARALRGGLPKLLRPSWGIRHGAARTVDNKRPMSIPAAFCGDGGLGRRTEALQEVFEDADGELGAGLTGGGGTEIAAGERGEMPTGRLAMEALQEQHLSRDHRLEEAITPCGIASGFTGGVDGLGWPWGRPICVEALEDRRHTGSPGGSPLKSGVAPPSGQIRSVCSSRPHDFVAKGLSLN
jgi:hypothetical protein